MVNNLLKVLFKEDLVGVEKQAPSEGKAITAELPVVEVEKDILTSMVLTNTTFTLIRMYIKRDIASSNNSSVKDTLQKVLQLALEYKFDDESFYRISNKT